MSVGQRGRISVGKTEGLVSLLTLLILIPILFLVYGGHTRYDLPANTFNINEVDLKAETLARTLHLNAGKTRLLLEERARRGNIENVDSMIHRRSLALDEPTIHLLQNHLVTRTPFQVFRSFTFIAITLVLTVFFLPLLLRQKMRLGGDPFILPLMLLLCGLGIAMLFSIKDPLRGNVAYVHHAQGILLAIIAFIFSTRFSSAGRQKMRRLQYVWALASLLLVGMLFVFGRGPEGVKLNLFGFFQPVEAIKLMLVFFLASYLSERAGLIADISRPFQMPRKQDMAPVVVMFGLALIMFYVIKDLGPGLLLFATFISVLYLTTGKSGFLGIGALFILCGGFLGYWKHIGVFGTRVDMWLSPFANTHSNGMQLGQAFWALASGGWEGSGLGLGMPNLIPRGQDDLAFISWSEETGLLGAWLVLIVFVCIIWRGIRIALRAANEFDRALAFGLTALIGLQTLLILGGVTGLIPLTGIALPFISYGNSALVADAILLGLLRGISAMPTGSGGGGLEASREVCRAAQSFALAMTVALLGVIGVWKMGQMQVWRANEIALRPIATPDKDKVVRPHLNPRLLALANAIPRGSIYDRAGRIVATSRPDEIALIAPDRADGLAANNARLYPYGGALAHIVGFIDAAEGGAFGMMERGYSNDLRGYVKFADLLADYRNRNLPGYQARKGHDLHLSIDANLQREVQQLLWKTAGTMKDKTTGRTKDRAAFVLMTPQTGDVLVAATFPTFDPNLLTPELYKKLIIGKEAEEEHPLINRAIDGLYAPGSTMKVATAACALENLKNAMNFPVTCNKVADKIKWQAGGKTYAVHGIHDDKGDSAFGTITMRTAFVQSSNIYFATLAANLPAETFHSTLANKMGFHRAPKQAAFDADLPYIGFGQGRMLASPLEMARLAACVANDGQMLESRFLVSKVDPGKDARDKARTQTFNPTLMGAAMRPDTAAILRDMMHEVTTGGTAAGVFDGVSVPVCGKTGTAQNREFDKEPHSWFIGFAPYGGREHPLAARYSFACIVENGGYGKKVAGRICADVLKRLF